MKFSQKILGLLICSCLLHGGCDLKTRRMLVDVSLATCPEPYAFLSGWWSGVDVDPDMDPIGGFVLVYWVDEEGNACHGTPGTNGQPGPFALQAYQPEVLAASRDGLVVSDTQLEQYQEILFSVEPYAASGLHFVQFDNTFWRLRSDRTAFRSGNSFSVPAVISMDQGSFCVSAVQTTQPECATTLAVPIPSLSGIIAGQHPSKCKIRARPTSISPSLDVRLDSCLLKLPHGLDITE